MSHGLIVVPVVSRLIKWVFLYLLLSTSWFLPLEHPPNTIFPLRSVKCSDKSHSFIWPPFIAPLPWGHPVGWACSGLEGKAAHPPAGLCSKRRRLPKGRAEKPHQMPFFSAVIWFQGNKTMRPSNSGPRHLTRDSLFLPSSQSSHVVIITSILNLRVAKWLLEKWHNWDLNPGLSGSHDCNTRVHWSLTRNASLYGLC